jgi:hypothetical protein
VRRGGTGRRATTKPIIVLAGEDRNDRTSLRVLLEAISPQMRGRIVEISDMVRLRQATGDTLKQRVAVLARKVLARAAREGAEVAGVFVHEDLDAVDSADYLATHGRVQNALNRHFRTAHYVLAVWEIEAWLLLFPDALVAFNRSWTVPARYRNKDTGLLADPKRLLVNEVSSAARRYRESDAPDILAKAVSLNRQPHAVGSNRSWQRMLDDANHWHVNAYRD